MTKNYSVVGFIIRYSRDWIFIVFLSIKHPIYSVVNK